MTLKRGLYSRSKDGTFQDTGEVLEYLVEYAGSSEEDAYRRFLSGNDVNSFGEVVNQISWMQVGQSSIVCEITVRLNLDSIAQKFTAKFPKMNYEGHQHKEYIETLRLNVSKAISASILMWIRQLHP